jgi:DNA-binding YbaB/EbfC family protein
MKSLTDMFKNFGNLEAMAQDMQNRVAAIEANGQSGAGLVNVTLSGQGNLTKVSIDPSLMTPDQAEVLADLLVTAHQDAKAKLETAMAHEMRNLTGGLPLPPGFKLPF